MIAELGRMNNQKDIRAAFLCQWTEHWLPKVVATVKNNTNELNKTRMRPILDVEKDLEEKNGNRDNIRMYAYIYIFL